MVSRVLEEIDNMREEIIAFCQKLIRFDTTEREEKAQMFIADCLNKMGFIVDIFEPDNDRLKNYWDYGAGNDYRGKPNVVGTQTGGGIGRSLILNAHIDTVSVEPSHVWKHDPFGGEVENNKIYGRGAADDKGNLAAAFMAVNALKKAGISPAGELIIESVVGEETDGNGTLSCCDRGYSADGAIVLDSIEPLDSIAVAQVGVAYFRLKVRGQSAHLCSKFTPKEGVNAIDKMRIFLNHLEKLQHERMKHHDSLYYPKVPIIGVTYVSGGGIHSRSTFPEECTAEVEYDYFFSELEGSENDLIIRNRIEKWVRELESEDDWLKTNPSSIEWVANIMPTTIDREHPIVRSLAQSIYRIAEVPKIVSIATSTDARHFEHVARIPVVSWSCGGENAHGIDECISIDDLMKGTKIIALTILGWCGAV
jgi:acetylornithine deacetylase